MNRINLGTLKFRLFLLLLPACAVRSISNPVRPWNGANTTYAGELGDFDVVGHDVAEAGDQGGDVVLHKGEHLLVVQSGAMFPDEQVLTGLAAHFMVGAASGIPSSSSEHGMRQLMKP